MQKQFIDLSLPRRTSGLLSLRQENNTRQEQDCCIFSSLALVTTRKLPTITQEARVINLSPTPFHGNMLNQQFLRLNRDAKTHEYYGSDKTKSYVHVNLANSALGDNLEQLAAQLPATVEVKEVSVNAPRCYQENISDFHFVLFKDPSFSHNPCATFMATLGDALVAARMI